MTIKELENRINTQTDNNFDQSPEFLAALNIIIEDLNLRMSAKFKTVDENEIDFEKTLDELTGIPSIMNIIIITGMSWKLQIKEDESTWTSYQATYNNYINEYKHLVPQDFRLENYNDIIFRDCDTKWEIF